jgi:lipoprotein-releasing system ATP-binding protein
MMLRAHGLTKTFLTGGKELCVLRGVDLTVARGESVAIVGPSGAGKSTLLHILGALDEPTQGAVYLDEVCLSRLDDARRSRVRNTRFGFVFQFYHLLREFSAQENVLLPALVRPGKKDVKTLRQKAASLLEAVGLGDRVSHRPGQLSGGEQQRVAIARALMNDPEILFCDEPTGNLDHASGSQVHELLMRLNRESRTTLVMVTHSPTLAEGAGRVLNIFDGVLSGPAGPGT